MTSRATAKSLAPAICAALVVVSFLAFSGSLSNGFVHYDDEKYVTANEHVRQGLTGASVRWAFSTLAEGNWHPLTWISHMLDVQWFGLDAGRHHLTSLLVHVANAVLLFLVFVRMTAAVWRSAAVAALFAVHPLHVESVAWIAERKDVLSTLFWLLTLAAWLRYLRSRAGIDYALVIGLFACGLMAKPMLVTLPFTLLLLDFWPLRRTVAVREKVALFAMSAASCILTFVAQRSAGAVQDLTSIALSERLENSVVSFATYLGKTVWPASLAVFYPYKHFAGPDLSLAASALVLAGLTALAWACRRKAPYLFVGWFWFAGTLVPVIGWVQVGAQAMADRYTYVPLIGVFVAVVWGIGELVAEGWVGRRTATAAFAVWLAALVAVTRVQVGHWADRTALFEHALAVTRDNWLAHNNLAAAFMDSGHLDEAIAHLTESLRIRPEYADARYNLGLALAKSGRSSEAIEQFFRVIRSGGDSAKLRNNLAGALAAAGRLDEAIVHLQQAVRLEPGNAESRFNLGNALLATGRPVDAIEQFEQVLRLDPADRGAAEGLKRAKLARGN